MSIYGKNDPDFFLVAKTKVVEFLEKRTEPPSNYSLEHGKGPQLQFQERAHFRRRTYAPPPQGRARPNPKLGPRAKSSNVSPALSSGPISTSTPRIPLATTSVACRRNVSWNLSPGTVPAGLSVRLLPGLKVLGMDKDATWDLTFTEGDLITLAAHGAVPALLPPPPPVPSPGRPPPPPRHRPASC